MTAYDPQSWQGFYVMVGGAAAALTGLLFVAMSLHAKTITQHPFFGARATGTLMSLTAQLLIAAAVLVPGLPLVLLGVAVEATAIFFLVTTVTAVLRIEPSSRPASRTRLRTVAEITGGTTWLVLFIASGISLLAHAGGGFYILAAVMAFMFAWNIYLAWTLITEISE